MIQSYITGWFKMFLQFDSIENAETANNQISQNMGLTGNVTSVWSDITKTADEKFVISKPDDSFMKDVINFQVAESYQPIVNNSVI
jgi:hypothetical protein